MHRRFRLRPGRGVDGDQGEQFDRGEEGEHEDHEASLLDPDLVFDPASVAQVDHRQGAVLDDDGADDGSSIGNDPGSSEADSADSDISDLLDFFQEGARSEKNGKRTRSRENEVPDDSDESHEADSENDLLVPDSPKQDLAGQPEVPEGPELESPELEVEVVTHFEPADSANPDLEPAKGPPEMQEEDPLCEEAEPEPAAKRFKLNPNPDPEVPEVEPVQPEPQPQPVGFEAKINTEGHRTICRLLLPELLEVLCESAWRGRSDRDQVREACARAFLRIWRFRLRLRL